MKFLRKLVLSRLTYVFFWGLLFAIWYFLRSADYPDEQTAFLVTVVKVGILLIIVVITNQLLLPGLLYKNRFATFVLAYVALIIGMGLIKIKIIGALVFPGLDPFTDFRTRVYDNIIPLFLLATTGAGFKVMADYFESRKRMALIGKEKAEAELKFLKSQINPHFLFNTLNSIYFLIDKSNTDARKALIEFSDLLRYQLYECNADTIDIEKELAYMNDYIRLQKLRKDVNVRIDVGVTEDVRGFRIVPLLLVPLIENAFKHISSNNDKDNFISIDISKLNGSLKVNVSNSKDNLPGRVNGHGGIGLPNLRRRLELLYPGKHQLDINDSAEVFSANLEIDIEEKSESQLT